MKRILILIIGLIGVAYGQSSPTSAKTRFVNGIYLGTKLDSYFNAADSNAIYWRADSVVMAKYKGTARALAFVGGNDFIRNQSGSNLAAQTAKFWVSDTAMTSGVSKSLQIFSGGSLNWPTSTSGNTAGRHIFNGDFGAGSQNGLIIWNENLDTSSKSFLWLSTKSALGAAYQSGAEFRGGIENTTDGQGFLEIRTTNTIGASTERGYIGGTGAVQWGSRNWPTASTGKTQGRMSIVSSSTPAYVAWNEATPAANNEAAIVLGAKTGQGATTLGGAKLYGGIYNAFTYAGYWKLTTITSAGGEATSLSADSLQNVTAANNLTVTNDTRSTTFSQGNWLQKLTSNHIDLDYSSVNKYRFRTDGIFQSKYAFEAYKDGSNSVAAGAYISLWNSAGTTGWLQQLNASNNLDIWYFNSGSGSIKQRFGNDGSISSSKIIGNSSTPSISGGSATYIGSGASTSVSGNDMAGEITLVTGTGCASTGASNRSALTVTFASAYSIAPIVQIQAIQQGGLSSTDGPTNQTFFLRRDAVGTSGFTVYLPIGVTLTDSTTYLITYQVIGR
jgi:hypothetical protein